MEKSFLDAVEKAYNKGEMSNPQFKEAIDYVRDVSEKATARLREKQVSKTKKKADELLR